MEAEKKFINDIAKVDRSSFSILTGLRAGIFVLLPLLLVPLVGYRGAGFAALGAMWLTNTESAKSKMPMRILSAACLSESLAVGVGTLAGNAGLLVPLLGGFGVFLPMLLHGNERWTRIGTYTAITFAMGIGLPGLSDAPVLRASYSLIGTFWALAGIAFQRYLQSKKMRTGEASNFKLHPNAIRSAVTVGVASAFGFWIGISLGLPRDFWVVVTIIITVQPSFNSTLKFTSRMVLGTMAGALIGAAVLYTEMLSVELAFLVAFAVLMFASRGVNMMIVQIFLAPFIIILLNLVYGGRADFAETRIVDVVIGGIISIATVYILQLDSISKYWTSHS